MITEMRQKMKRRWFACLWSAFLIFCLWFMVSMFRSKPGHASHGSNFKSPDDVKLKLIVVEEHHEVLGAWSEAFLSGVLPPNSTLIHIDAHSDDGLPDWTPKYPSFRLPRSEEEVDHMMQTNDRFIMGAKISHLIDRLVWIYPFWNEEVLYSDMKQDIGTTVFRGQMTFCECRTDKETKCMVFDEKSGNEEPITYIDRRLCNIKRRTRLEIIRDVFARTRLPVDKNWLGRDNLAVDIDEDFFGVHLVGNYLLSAGIDWKDVRNLSSAISRVVCPLIPAHESIADQWFYKLIQKMHDHCVEGRGNIKNLPLWCNDSKAAYLELFRPFRADKKYSQSKIFCHWDKSADVDVDAKRDFIRIWNILRRYNAAQLLAFQRTGVCLQLSMRTFGVEPKLQLCIGSNHPNETAVGEHWPSPPELKQQYERFRLILQHLPSRPRIITLCRSSRDGYVPRELQGAIERNIVTIIREVFKLSDSDIVYDSLLLNGKTGDWFNRKYQ